MNARLTSFTVLLLAAQACCASDTFDTSTAGCSAKWVELVSAWSLAVGGLDQSIDEVAERTAHSNVPFAKILVAVGDDWREHEWPPRPQTDATLRTLAQGLLLNASNVVGDECAHSTRWLEAALAHERGIRDAAWPEYPGDRTDRGAATRWALEAWSTRATFHARAAWEASLDIADLATRAGLGSIWHVDRGFADPDRIWIDAYGDRRTIGHDACATTVVQLDLAEVDAWGQRSSQLALVGCDAATYEDFKGVEGPDEAPTDDAQLADVAVALRALLDGRVARKFADESARNLQWLIAADHLTGTSVTDDAVVFHFLSRESVRPLIVEIDLTLRDAPAFAHTGEPPEILPWRIDE